jgi:hypothetical protein
MPFNLPDIDQEVEGCLYKLFYGNKYIIAKGKTLAGSIFLLEKGYAYFLVGGGGQGNNATGEGHKEGDGKNSYYHKLYSYIKKNPGLMWRLEVLLETNNGYDLLKREQQELNAAIKDKNLLNNNLYSYIPKYRSTTKMYGWLNKGSVLAFKKFLKNM